MYVGKDFSPIEPGELDTFSFEVTNDLPPGVTVSSQSWACSLALTVPGASPDGAANTRISGSATVTTESDPVSGTVRTFLNQKAGNMVDGNLYILDATYSTSDGRALSIHSRVRCKAKA